VSRPPRVPGTPGRKTERALFVVPSPNQPGLTEAERFALRLRRDATVTGRCVCGAVRRPVRANRATLNHAAMVHENDCPAADGSHFQRLVERLGPGIAYELITADVEVAA
jgi:hypothetical protein